jgi:hypothetical protein
MGMRNAYKTLARKPEGKRLLGGPMQRWEENIIMYHREIRWEGVDCIFLGQDTL